MNKNMKTISDPGSPKRASSPIARDDDSIFLEDTLPLERSFEDNYDEALMQETNLERSWRKRHRC